jgi:hypothetical protein
MHMRSSNYREIFFSLQGEKREISFLDRVSTVELTYVSTCIPCLSNRYTVGLQPCVQVEPSMQQPRTRVLQTFVCDMFGSDNTNGAPVGSGERLVHSLADQRVYGCRSYECAERGAGYWTNSYLTGRASHYDYFYLSDENVLHREPG